jgi:hypothetical protein
MTRFGSVVVAVAVGVFLGGASARPLIAQVGGARPAGSAADQSPTEGTAAMSGVVSDAVTHRPLPGVIVYLGFQGRGAVGRLSRQVSDAKGRFVFTDLPAGANYFINASKFGYLDGHVGVGAGGSLGGLITLKDGQWFADANIEMQRLSSISGTVLDERNEPVVGAFVRVLARISVAGRVQLAAGPAVTTDDRGVYRIPNLPPGKYLVQVPSVQQSFPAMMTAAELAGITQDPQGPSRPIPDPPPALEANGSSRLVVGSYLVPPASSPGARSQAYAPILFPNAPGLTGAATIEIKAGESRSDIDFSLALVPVSSISGVVVGPADVLPGLVVRLLPEGLEDLGGGSEVATSTIDASGRFTLFNVPSGAYTLDVRRSVSELAYRSPLVSRTATLPSSPGAVFSGMSTGSILSGPSGANYSNRSARGSNAYFAREKLAVGASAISNFVVTLRRGASIRGRFVTETGASPFPDRSPSTPVYAEPADGNLGLGMLTSERGVGVAADTFEINGLLPGPYLLRFLSVGNLSVLSVMADGEDHRFKPFDATSGRDFDVVITLTDKKVDLSGSVADTRGALIPGAVVIVFPVEREQWTNYGLSPVRLKGTASTTSGSYRFQSLPAGDYYVVGVPPEQSTIWQDPAMLAKLVPLATRVSLAWGDKKTQNLIVVKIQ